MTGPAATDRIRELAALATGQENGEEPRRFEPVPLSIVLPEPPVRELIRGFLLADEINGLHGDGDAGKSSISYATAEALASGRELFGRFPVPESASSLIVTSGEDRQPLIRNRVAAIATGCGEAPADLLEILARIHVLDCGLNLDSLADLLALQSIIAEHRYRLLILDPIGDLIGDKANTLEDRDVRRVYRHIRTYLLAPNPGLAVLINGHATKSAEGRNKRQRVFGSAAWTNGLRQSWFVERTADGCSLDSSPKGNRRPDRPCYAIRREVETEADGLTWRTARFTVAEASAHRLDDDVVTVLRIVDGCAAPPCARDLESLVRESGLGQNRATSAIAKARSAGLIESLTRGKGGRTAYVLSHIGRGRLGLAPALALEPTP